MSMNSKSSSNLLLKKMMLKNIGFLLFLIINIKSIECGFQKDLDLNIAFPPILDKRDGIPTGHLRPLGWQNRAEAPVTEESVLLTPEQFWDKYVNKSKPIVIRGLIFGSAAVDKWTDIYLNRAYGSLDIRVSQRRQSVKRVEEETTQMNFKKFLQGYRVDDWYLRCIMPEEMLEETPIPHLINCGPFVKQNDQENEKDLNEEESNKQKLRRELTKGLNKKKELPKIAQLVEPYLWMSAGETSSLLHSHPEHTLHCVLDGRKDFILIPTDQFKKLTTSTNPAKQNDWRKLLDLHETYPHSSEWFSKLDVDMVNAFKFKILQDIIWYWSSLRAGDCIYIPADYLNQVRSHGRSISSSIYFNKLRVDHEFESSYDSVKSELFSQCPANAPLFQTMESYKHNFLWTYTHSERHLNKKNILDSDARLYLLYLLRQENQLHFERFDAFFTEITKELKEHTEHIKNKSIKDLAQLSSQDIWNDLIKDSKSNQLDSEQIFSSKLNLNRFVKVLNVVVRFHDSDFDKASSKDEL